MIFGNQWKYQKLFFKNICVPYHPTFYFKRRKESTKYQEEENQIKAKINKFIRLYSMLPFFSSVILDKHI